MPRRNPAIDPHPGDRLRYKLVTRQVLAIEKPPKDVTPRQPVIVCHEEHDDGFKMKVRPFLSQWQRWADEAEVIEYGT